MTRVVFETDDPKSAEWRAAWRRYVGRMLEPFQTDFEEKIIKEVHHRGWRAGVTSVRRRWAVPTCPRTYYDARERRAWEHGAVAGRAAARRYVETSGTDPSKLH